MSLRLHVLRTFFETQGRVIFFVSFRMNVVYQLCNNRTVYAIIEHESKWGMQNRKKSIFYLPLSAPVSNKTRRKTAISPWHFCRLSYQLVKALLAGCPVHWLILETPGSRLRDLGGPRINPTFPVGSSHPRHSLDWCCAPLAQVTVLQGQEAANYGHCHLQSNLQRLFKALLEVLRNRSSSAYLATGPWMADGGVDKVFLSSPWSWSFFLFTIWISNQNLHSIS
jgi:hypothetical protein